MEGPGPVTSEHRNQSEQLEASQAAEASEQTVRECFRLATGQFLCFDLVLLGTGADGHSASLFPETIALREQIRPITPPRWHSQRGSEAATLREFFPYDRASVHCCSSN